MAHHLQQWTPRKYTNIERKKPSGSSSHTYGEKQEPLLRYSRTQMSVTFGTDNTIEKHLAARHEHNRNKYENSGIYQLTCPTCNTKYTSQTGRLFRVWFQEHFRDFKNGNGKSRFAAHLLQTKQSFGPMENIMENLHTVGKGQNARKVLHLLGDQNK
jgi:hypothetical protein